MRLPAAPRTAWRPLILVLALGSCQPTLRSPESAPTAANQARELRRFPIDVGEHTGLSDLTLDASGHFWSAPERQRVLLRLNLTRDNPGLDTTPIALEGIPDGHDTESLVWLADNLFASGTETQVTGRLSDDIFLLRVGDGVATVSETLAFPYRLWHLRGRANNGLEGLCHAAGNLLAAAETTGITPSGRRFAPLGRYNLAERTWTAFSLLLTSRIGKISALACRADKTGEGIEVLAVERHIGVSHLLHFSVPAKGPGSLVEPDTLVDLGHVIDAVPNLEGVSWSPDGDIFLLSDNDFGIVTGPTQVIVIPRTWR